MEGTGVLKNSQGRYEGNFHQGYKEGSGVLYFNDGTVFRGIFANNTIDKGEL